MSVNTGAIPYGHLRLMAKTLQQVAAGPARHGAVTAAEEPSQIRFPQGFYAKVVGTQRRRRKRAAAPDMDRTGEDSADEEAGDAAEGSGRGGASGSGGGSGSGGAGQSAGKQQDGDVYKPAQKRTDQTHWLAADCRALVHV